MAYTRWLATEVLGVVRDNRFWMTWNLILAFIPAVLAVGLFWRERRRTVGWWLGVVVFALFLPNAPYVLTDLIHLRWDAARAASDGVLVFGVLPIYGAFVALGMASYVFCMALIVREVRRTHPTCPQWRVELPVHLLCSVGIVLGRITRLNSWDTVVEPTGTLERIFTTLTWRGAPFAIAVIFVAVFTTFTVLRALISYAAAWGGGWAERLGWVGELSTREAGGSTTRHRSRPHGPHLRQA